MEKQKLVKFKFPLIDAYLLTPTEAERGQVSVCTNTTAPGQILNDIKEEHREKVAVLGSLMVNRDGAERMILNSLVHSTVRYIILFSEENLTFSPSTNLLQAIIYGYDNTRNGNFIANGVSASPQYPSISKNVLDCFRENIVILPLFMSKNKKARGIIDNYLEFIKERIERSIYDLLKEANQKDKIYFDTLNTLIALLEPVKEEKSLVNIDPKGFQKLQPPKIKLEPMIGAFSTVPFFVSVENGAIRLDIQSSDDSFYIKGEDDFLIGYSLMKYLGDKKNIILTPLEQLLLGAELGRAKVALSNGIFSEALTASNGIRGGREVLLQSHISLLVDKKFYYKVNMDNEKLLVACLAFDDCEDIFELETGDPRALLAKIAEMNRFADYEMDILHRIDIGSQIGKAAIAAKNGYFFAQDFAGIFKINKEKLPLLITEGDNFLSVHKGALMRTFTEGITEEHADEWKGLARTGVVLSIFRNGDKAFNNIPAFYDQGDISVAEAREAYKEQLLRFDHDGSYSYGERTRAHFGFDQLKKVTNALRSDPNAAALIQRYDPLVDMSREEDGGKVTYSHDPCLTHDIFFVINGRLHSFHIARAHNLVNAYFENILGLFDAYYSSIKKELGLAAGDMYMLSNRGNILLLTEEQKLKRIISEPSKPVDEFDVASGLYQLGSNRELPEVATGVALYSVQMTKNTKRPKEIIESLENFGGIDTVEKAIQYLRDRGVSHNNPILCQYQPGTADPQGEYLVFFQANVFGGKINTTAVFMNRSLKNVENDIQLCNYLSTRYASKLKLLLGNLNVFYVKFKQ